MKFKFFSSLMIVACLSACDPVTPPLDMGLVISDARVQMPMNGKSITSGYFDITNHSNVDDSIIGIESPVAERVEMHLSEEIDGIMKMRRQVAIDIKAGESVSFKPGGYHLMLFGVGLKADQNDAAVTFKFKHASDVTIIAEIAESALHTGHH